MGLGGVDGDTCLIKQLSRVFSYLLPLIHMISPFSCLLLVKELGERIRGRLEGKHKNKEKEPVRVGTVCMLQVFCNSASPLLTRKESGFF